MPPEPNRTEVRRSDDGRKVATRALPSRLAAGALKAPIHLYRYTVSMLMGRWCRHLPTCSDYALEAIDRNGPWRGAWLMVARCSRCHPWGSSGFDPVPDIRAERHMWTPWRYGRWRGPPAPGDHEPGR